MTDVYQMVTDRILDMFDRNIVPWRCPWTRTGAGCISYSTGRPYSLLNQLLLGGRPGEYITFNQARELGGNVRKGEKSRFVVFWKLLEEKDDETGDISIKPLLRYYNVFHIDQCEHISPRWAGSVQDAAVPTLHHDDKAEKAILDYIDRSGVTYIPQKSDRAYYSPSEDKIVVPELAQFTELAEYYSCAFHEIVHSTGAPNRLDRLDSGYSHESYSREELVAEMGSAFLCHRLGIDSPSSLSNSAAYIKGWSNALKRDKKLVVWAAGKAEKSADYVLGINREEDNDAAEC